ETIQNTNPADIQSSENKNVTTIKTNASGSESLWTQTQNDPQKREGLFRQMIEEKNSPIEFFGRFIDQDSNALSGVNVKLVIRQWYVPVPGILNSEGREIHLEKTTDLDGRFEINGEKGDAIDVESTKKDGYQVEPGKRTYGAVSGRYESPVSFKMWATNIHEQLITGERKFQIVPDGRAYFINLTDGTIAESGTGDLKVWVKYPAQVTRGQLYDWSCEIDAINGGLLEEPLGTAMYSAPADGYTPSFQLQQQIKGGQYGEIGERHFYVRLKDGQEYGQITINLYASYTDQIPGLIRLSYAINPSGSRILR
ncbi:MAG TPA: hypothetical protein VFC17_11625, partial [Candidatus Limnocylindrales bacterium]|nr:hypothetical protein [Candidatus Limnocylindrales bacterium]